MLQPRLPAVAPASGVGCPTMSPRRIACIAVLASACGGGPAATLPTTPPPGASAAGEPAPRPARVKQYDAATLFKNVGVVPAGFSHDGSRALVSMDSSGVYNLYAIPTAGGAPQR